MLILLRAIVFLGATLWLAYVPSSQATSLTESLLPPIIQQAIATLVREELPLGSSEHHISLLSSSASLASLRVCTSSYHDQPLAQFTRVPERLTGRVMVKIMCSNSSAESAPTAIQQFVQLQVEVIGSYWVTKAELAAGTPLQSEHIDVVTGPLQRLPRHAVLGQLQDHPQLLGQTLRRSLSKGSIIQENLLQATQVIRFGDDIIITAEGPGFVITRSGKAMDTAAVGDRIRVKLDNQRIIQVLVTGKGTAKAL
ncbi:MULTISPECIES: flagellar basal body P-ring formation chaperone FlgA [Pseudidiomarina]|uniref:Flagella basal body P-ring formation protein FlgA n=3 Tax=Pseudidiomarina TaxID=2800384 RepID=A0A368UYN8_9GAMM|nr:MULTISPECIES: flagellar basal body P-ring formation chaperone FlgA [Pseudidiomarina]PWW13787.1 flagella basal body P-ring formation protein FlgA [Pseudidiomarina maritima]RBP91181.1 flagella basal body P-ring formation protein FlgA [Pseudidiomarina tainanensis]RCW33195.1 flagella basal body P-ring formation protein FlgA [Pseudidiomarina tainanensis]